MSAHAVLAPVRNGAVAMFETLGQTEAQNAKLWAQKSQLVQENEVLNAEITRLQCALEALAHGGRGLVASLLAPKTKI